MEQKIPERILNIRTSCLSHAEDLIRAAKGILHNDKLPNIAYSLAVLALEEIGKSVLLMMGHFANERESTWNPQHLSNILGSGLLI